MTPRIMLTAASVLTLMGCADEEENVTFFSLLPESNRGVVAAANLPPDSFQGEFWIDRDGCSYIRTDSGQWVPRMNVDMTRMCDQSRAASAMEPVSTPKSGFAAPAPKPISIDPNTGQVSQVRPEFNIPVTYVQVGSYNERAAGLAVREKFASLGFPIVGRDKTPPEGRALTVVLGPYTDSGFLDDALQTAKSMGHNDAYIFQNQ